MYALCRVTAVHLCDKGRGRQGYITAVLSAGFAGCRLVLMLYTGGGREGGSCVLTCARQSLCCCLTVHRCSSVLTSGRTLHMKQFGLEAGFWERGGRSVAGVERAGHGV